MLTAGGCYRAAAAVTGCQVVAAVRPFELFCVPRLPKHQITNRGSVVCVFINDAFDCFYSDFSYIGTVLNVCVHR